MLKDYFKLAYHSARKRKMRSWLTMIGIFIGIAAVVSLISLSQGMRTAIEQQFMNLGTDKLIVQAAGSSFGPPGTAVSVPLTDKDLDSIEKVKGVDTAVGRLLRITKLEFREEIKYTYVVSLPADSKRRELVIESNNYKIEQGKILEADSKYQVMVGPDFAKNFFKEELRLRNKVKVQGQTFEISGILKKSGNPQSDSTLVLPEKTLREILSVPNDYDMIAVKIQNGASLEQVAENIKKELRKTRNVEKGKEDFNVQTPEALLAMLTNILLIIQSVLVGIAAISLLVGGIGIMNTMYTAVLERTKEIGIMKAVGARNNSILSLFLIESGMLGLFGGIIGVTLGLLISKSVEIITFQIYESQLIQASFSPLLIIGALLFSFLIGAFSGLFPAQQAAKLRPVEALRQ